MPSDRADQGAPGRDEAMSGPNTGSGHDHAEMVRRMREKWLWTNFTVIALGVWLASSPRTFGYHSPAMT
jgi:hypothetical protein